MFFLSACGNANTNNSTNTNTSTGNGGSVASTSGNMTITTQGVALDSNTSVPAVKLGTQPCPNAVSAPSYWDTIVGTQANLNKVESVTCANLIGNAMLQALVDVRIDGSGGFLDFYVYDKITNPHPQQLFKLQGLEHGDAKISGYNTQTCNYPHILTINIH